MIILSRSKVKYIYLIFGVPPFDRDHSPYAFSHTINTCINYFFLNSMGTNFECTAAQILARGLERA